MNVNIQSIKFDADKKLIEFVEKKLEKLARLCDDLVGVDVFLRIDSQPIDNKKVEIKLEIPGHDLFAERTCKSFEEATDECVNALKVQIEKAKEKARAK